MSDIKTLIQQMLNKSIPMQARVCKVISVDTTKWVCDLQPNDDTAVINDARLIATEGATGMIVVPKVGSWVIAASIWNRHTEAWVAQCTEVESISLTVGGDPSALPAPIPPMTLSIQADGTTTFNGGTLGGLVKINDLLTKINNLENKVNTIISTFNTHIHPTPSGPSSLTGTLITPPLTPTLLLEIEDTNIKH